MTMRVLMAFAAVAAASLMTLGVAAADAAPSPWLQTGYNAAGSRANLAETTLTPANVATVVPRHTYVGKGAALCSPGASFPVISETKVYYVDGGALYSRTLATGKLLWRMPLPDPGGEYYVDIAVSHGVVILGSDECGTQDPIGDVSAYDSTTGAFVWGGTVFGDGLDSVEVSGSLVVAHSFFGVESNAVTKVLRISDGSTVWETPNSFDYCGLERHVVGGHIFVQWCGKGGHQLRALDLYTGAIAWRHGGDLGVQRGDSDGADATHLYVYDFDTARMLDLDPATGATQLVLAGATSVLAVDASRVYASCGSAVVCAFDAATGSLRWRKSASVTQAIEANGVLYLDDGAVLKAATGRRLTSLPGSPQAVGSGRLALLAGQPAGLQIYALP